MKNESNKGEEINILLNHVENFVINIIDDSFIEIFLNKFLIHDNGNEKDKQMIKIIIKNDKRLNFKYFRYSFLNMFFMDLSYTINQVQDKAILKILSTLSVNYIRPLLAKKSRMYEIKSMIALEKKLIKKFNKKIKNVIFKEFEENIYNNDNFIKNVYLDSFNNTFLVYENYIRLVNEVFSILTGILIFIFFYPLLFKLRFGLLRNIFNTGFATIYAIFVYNIYKKAKKDKFNNAEDNELKNIIYSFFQNINIIVESNTLENELNKVLKHVKNMMDNHDGALNKYISVKNDPAYVKQMGKKKIIDTGVSILINDASILSFLEFMRPKIVDYIEKKTELYKKTVNMRDFIDILNTKPYQVAKTIPWSNNTEYIFVLEDVTLEYEGKDGIKNKVLENISLNFEIGKSHFIYGNSGCGKTTLLNALMERIKISSGLIKFLGIYEYTYFSIRQYLTYITSESTLFSKDLYYNIIYGIDEKVLMEKERENEVTETIIKYMTLFRLDKFIPTMKTTNATKLSKGQTQRVSIVRLFIGIIFNDTRILFLDEFTSNIDNKMEEIIFTELRNLQKNPKYNFTIFYVSHNLYNMKYSDYNYEIDTETHSIKQVKTTN